MSNNTADKWGATRRALLVAGAALPTLHDRYGLSTDAISNSLKSWLR